MVQASLLLACGLAVIFTKETNALTEKVVRPSPGCGPAFQDDDFPRNKYFQHRSLDDTREWTEFVPNSYNASRPAPLLIYVHGQYGHATSVAQELPFSRLASKPLITAYPQGIDDAEGADCGTGWNVGVMGHDTSTCDAAAFTQTCCYKTCRHAGLCSGDGKDANCGWSTCLDDMAFLLELVSTVSEELCIDLNSVYLAGGSNGGMFVHSAYAQAPDVFKSVNPVYGLPLVGHIDVPEKLTETSIYHFHDRSDGIIPADGGLAGGWEYESADDVLATWASLHECDEKQTRLVTPHDGGRRNAECFEHANCKTNQQVVKCMYDGNHGDWPDRGQLLLCLNGLLDG